MSHYTTDMASIGSYTCGSITVIDDDKKNYVFSNMFDVAANSRPYERVAVAKNFEYVVEAARAEGVSPWYTAAHDEFVVALDGQVEVKFIKLDHPDSAVGPKSEGAHRIEGTPEGRSMGYVKLDRGHMALLPVGAAYQFSAPKACALMIQSIDGPETVHKWSEICQK